MNRDFSNCWLVLEVTASDFTPSQRDVSVKYAIDTSNVWINMIGSVIERVILFRGINFTYSRGESECINIKVHFNTPNPSDRGKYKVRIWLEFLMPSKKLEKSTKVWITALNFRVPATMTYLKNT